MDCVLRFWYLSAPLPGFLLHLLHLYFLQSGKGACNWMHWGKITSYNCLLCINMSIISPEVNWTVLKGLKVILNNSFTSQQQTFTFILIVPLCIIQNPLCVFPRCCVASVADLPQHVIWFIEAFAVKPCYSFAIWYSFSHISWQCWRPSRCYFQLCRGCAVKCLGQQWELHIPLALGVPSARSSDLK